MIMQYCCFSQSYWFILPHTFKICLILNQSYPPPHFPILSSVFSHSNIYLNNTVLAYGPIILLILQLLKIEVLIIYGIAFFEENVEAHKIKYIPSELHRFSKIESLLENYRKFRSTMHLFILNILVSFIYFGVNSLYTDKLGKYSIDFCSYFSKQVFVSIILGVSEFYKWGLKTKNSKTIFWHTCR